MPEYPAARRLNDADLTDIVGYLGSLRGEGGRPGRGGRRCRGADHQQRI